MDAKIYKFKPLYKTIFEATVFQYKLLVIVMGIIFCVAIIFFKQTPVVLIPIFVLILFVLCSIKIAIKFAEVWIMEGYSKVKVDGQKGCIFLDAEIVPFSSIAFAEVLFSQRPEMYKPVWENILLYIFLVNAMVKLHMKNGEQYLIPVQVKPSLSRMIKVLRKYIVVKYDENNKFMNEGNYMWLCIVFAILLVMGLTLISH